MTLFQIESIAVIFSLLSVILTIKKSIWCWPIGIVGIIFYMILFAQSEIWGNSILQAIFIIQSIFGWYTWNSAKSCTLLEKPIHEIGYLNSGKEKVSTWQLIIGVSLILTGLITAILLICDGSTPYFDGITTSLSMVAMLLMAYKKIECWIIWVIVDIIFIVFFYTSGFYLSSLVYLVFLVLAILGFLEWKRNIKVD